MNIQEIHNASKGIVVTCERKVGTLAKQLVQFFLTIYTGSIDIFHHARSENNQFPPMICKYISILWFLVQKFICRRHGYNMWEAIPLEDAIRKDARTSGFKCWSSWHLTSGTICMFLQLDILLLPPTGTSLCPRPLSTQIKKNEENEKVREANAKHCSTTRFIRLAL